MFYRRFGPILSAAALCAGLLLTSMAAGQTIWYVDAANCPGPGDGSAGNPFCEIQPAINAAAPNATPPDEIVVAAGTYTGAGNKDLDFGGKGIKLHSAGYNPNACIIDCQGAGRGFYFHSGETAAAEVAGFTIRGGSVTSSSPGQGYGGGVYCAFASSPTLINCVISENDASTSGGGVFCNGSSAPTLICCSVLWNVANLSGGGVYCSDSDPDLSFCTIGANTTYGNGGGVYGSASGPTLSDCEVNWNTARQGGAAYFNSDSGPVLAGCIVSENAASSSGGGLLFTSSCATLSDCAISGNTAGADGGGVSCYYSSDLMLTTCVIDGNTAQSTDPFVAYGGGVDCFASNPTLTACTISGNTADYGGGLSIDGYSEAVVTDCTIIENTTLPYGGGGGVYSGGSSIPVLTTCTISGNSVSEGGDGGGVHCYQASAVLTNCIISENAGSGAYAYGGGIYCDQPSSRPTLTNCTLRGNTSGRGGGVYCYLSYPTLTNCTISGNTATTLGGGMYATSGAAATLTNCISWGNMPQEVCVFNSTATINYSNVQGGWAGIGNSDVPPLFVSGTDLHLTLTSPCIDAGTNTPPSGLPGTDADGTVRPQDGDNDGLAVADMGAYELVLPTTPVIEVAPAPLVFAFPEEEAEEQTATMSIRNRGGGTLHWTMAWNVPWLQADPTQGESAGEPQTVVLTANSTGLPSGVYPATLEVTDPQALNSPLMVEVALHVGPLRVPSQFATLQAAIDAAKNGEQVIVADGTYTGPGNRDLDFHAKAITVRSESGNAAACIIDCQRSGRGFYFHHGETAASVLSGLTIRNGLVTFGSPGSYYGGGIYCYSSSPTITNCRISGNTATSDYSWAQGGGVHCAHGSSPRFVDCTISENVCSEGGGIYCGSSCAPTLINCTISGNSQSGVYCASSSAPTLLRCMISGNSGGYGAGVSCYSLGWEPTTKLVNCIIQGNHGYRGGGVFAGEDSDIWIGNCTLSGNTASCGYGGGVYCSSPWSAGLVNCILWGDTQPEVYDDSAGGHYELSYCDVQGGYWGAGNVHLDPLFADPDGPDNDPNTWQDNDYRLAAGSPCIDAGQNSAVPADTFDLDEDGDTSEPIPFDLDGLPRFVDDPATADCPYVPGSCGTAPIVDMGAYEYRPLVPLGDLNCDGLVDINDVGAFVMALVDPAGYQAAYPGCDPLRADMNASGAADGADVQLFVDALLGG